VTDHTDHPAIRAVLESEEYRRAVEEHPAEPLPDTDHPEGGLVRDGRGDLPPEARRQLRRKVTYLMPSYRRPDAVWLPSPNFWPGRLGHDMSQPSWVVLHTMVCCWQSAWGRFQQASQQASSTYGVCLDGHVIQFVDERDGPWTNGTNAGTGANADSITIEHEDCGDYNGPRTEALYATSAQLVREICQRYSIPIDRQHIVKHNECSGSSTACPDSLDVDRIVRMAVGQAPLPVAQPQPITAGGRMFIPYDVTKDPFDEVYADVHGECRWGLWSGGAGQAGGWEGELFTLGSPEGAKDLVQCDGAHTTHDGALRLNVRGVRSNGDRYLLVVDLTAGKLIQGWRKMPSTPRQFVAAAVGPAGPAGPVGAAGPPGEAVTDDHIAEMAVAAMRAELLRLANG
jgi:hypothetical protein